MKNVLFFCLIIVGLLGAACNKGIPRNSATTTGATVYRGIVIHNICCLDVIQTLGPSYLGQASWIDSGNTAYPVYTHVFKVANPCQFGNHVEGDTISFKVIYPEEQNCACCMVYIPTPGVSYPIEVTN